MRIPSFLTAFLFLSVLASGMLSANESVTIGKAAWLTDARRLTGESDAVRTRAIARLRANPQLELLLHDGLKGTNRFLALDVISALHLRSMIDPLLKYGSEETSGYVIHTVNTLLEAGDRPKVFQTYREWLDLQTTSFPNQVAILDSFSRTNEMLETGTLLRLLNEGHPEVRSAVLLYVRSQILKRGREEYIPLVVHSVSDPTFQNRVQAYALVSEFNLGIRSRHPKEMTEVASLCGKEEMDEVRFFCQGRSK